MILFTRRMPDATRVRGTGTPRTAGMCVMERFL